MFELLSQVERLYPIAKLLAVVFAVAALTYTLQTAFGPLTRIVQWLFAYTPGDRPGDVTAGVAYGVRLVAWAVLIGLGMWFVVH